MEEFIPLVHGADGRHWRIGRGGRNSSVDVPSATVTAGRSDSDIDKNQRAYALTAARVSPRRWHSQRADVPDELYRAVENARVGSILDQARWVDSEGMYDRWGEKLVPTQELEALAKLAAARFEQDPFTALGPMLSIAGKHDVFELRDFLNREFAEKELPSGFVSMYEMTADWLVDKFEDDAAYESGVEYTNQIWDFINDLRGDLPANPKDTDKKTEKMLRHMSPPPSDQGDKWGKMDMVKRRMPARIQGQIDGYRRIASDRGVTPKNIHRWCSDKKVFQRKVKKGSAVVLIDGSGSMEWSNHDLKKVMELLPGSIIAIYAGGLEWYDGVMDENLPVGDDWGVLQIVAENGKIVDFDREFSYSRLDDGRYIGGSNLIDGPALRWLAKQNGKKFWVSDEGVHGLNHQYSSQHLLMECHRICKQNDITIYRHVHEVAEATQEMRNAITY